jgi:flagellar hook-length control protein FliK
MVKHGQQEARLHLNPTDMGPIQVRIQIDGNHARVDLLAEQAPTRHVLEQAMPVLAGALRDSGLTLTGGGVFQQPRDPRQPAGGRAGAGQGSRSARGDGTEGDSARLAMDPLRSVGPARGVLDLYA